MTLGRSIELLNPSEASGSEAFWNHEGTVSHSLAEGNPDSRSCLVLGNPDGMGELHFQGAQSSEGT